MFNLVNLDYRAVVISKIESVGEISPVDDETSGFLITMDSGNIIAISDKNEKVKELRDKILVRITEVYNYFLPRK